MSDKKQDIDTLTHPSLYRESVNGASGTSSSHGNNTFPTQAKKEQEGDDWDLYPQLVRKIENEGSKEQVKHLHELENSHCK
ncbi:hypothetical protein BCV72DRAFT_272081 [Rhizopus microsporus var. microsporus]|uniref:Uncharacterized protein n=1 Tax=Rhizopus microsporus var. microsporus TaxID=86635 RepID=A0A1X0R8C8_RHIZD|nr:hypothetical protein BCV72DRAFT_272081 [Rhizopus microsporus var. microsporus]